MTAPQPFSLKIFVADGDPDGLRLIERSNWIGKAVVFPRAIYTRVRSRPEFQQTGVYLLIGPRINGDGDMITIGEGDPVGPRLEGQYAKKDFWTHVDDVLANPPFNDVDGSARTTTCAGTSQQQRRINRRLTLWPSLRNSFNSVSCRRAMLTSAGCSTSSNTSPSSRPTWWTACSLYPGNFSTARRFLSASGSSLKTEKRRYSDFPFGSEIWKN